jgi:hypothetical protein
LLERKSSSSKDKMSVSNDKKDCSYNKPQSIYKKRELPYENGYLKSCLSGTKHLSAKGHAKFADFLWNKIQLAYQ